MKKREEAVRLAKQIAELIAENGYTTDADIKETLEIREDFELIKAKNILMRLYGIAVEKWIEIDDQKIMAIFFSPEFEKLEGNESERIQNVFSDSGFRSRRIRKEKERRVAAKDEIKELLNQLESDIDGNSSDKDDS